MPPNRDRDTAAAKDEERVMLASPRNADRRPRRCRTSSQTRKRRYFSVDRERVPSDWDGAPQCGGGETGPDQLIGIVAGIIHQKVNVSACRGAPYGLEQGYISKKVLFQARRREMIGMKSSQTVGADMKKKFRERNVVQG